MGSPAHFGVVRLRDFHRRCCSVSLHLWGRAGQPRTFSAQNCDRFYLVSEFVREENGWICDFPWGVITLAWGSWWWSQPAGRGDSGRAGACPSLQLLFAVFSTPWLWFPTFVVKNESEGQEWTESQECQWGSAPILPLWKKCFSSQCPISLSVIPISRT